jgi:hypothetical protein
MPNYTPLAVRTINVVVKKNGGAPDGTEPWTVYATGAFDGGDFTEAGTGSETLTGPVHDGREYRIVFDAISGYVTPTAIDVTAGATPQEFEGDYLDDAVQTTSYAGLNIGANYIHTQMFHADMIDGGEWWNSGGGYLEPAEQAGSTGSKVSWPGNGKNNYYKLVGLKEPGSYTLAWQSTGDCTFTLSGDGGVDESVDTAIAQDGRSGTLPVTVTGITDAEGEQNALTITVLTTDGSLRVQFHLTSYDLSVKRFLDERVDEFTAAGPGVLRLMNWNEPGWDNVSTTLDDLGIANSPPVQDYWFSGLNQRDLIQAGIDLCNQCDTDLWWCLPPKISDAAVTELGEMVAATYTDGAPGQGLNPAKRVWVELGNEVWNGTLGFVDGWPDTIQQTYFLAAWAAHADRDRMENPTPSGDTGKILRFQTWRSYEIHNLVETEVGASRLVRVLCHQIDAMTVPEYNQLEQEMLITIGSSSPIDMAQQFEMIAGNVYFGTLTNQASPDATLDVDATFDWINNISPYVGQGQMKELTDAIAAAAITLNTINPALVLCAYEGGQHLLLPGGSQAQIDYLESCQEDSRMGTAYTTMLTAWFAESNTGTFCHFECATNTSQFGGWGIKEHWGDATSAKWAAWTAYGWPTP